MKDGEKEERERHSSIPRAQLPKSVNNVARRPNKPNAYNYYKKLVQDFESLDRELHETEATSQSLVTKINHMQLGQEEALHEELVCQQMQWEQEREHRIEEMLHKNEEVDALHAKLDDLDAQEMRVLAQIQILQDKQQEEIRTEAYRIHEVVHKRTHLLEMELAKGQMDLEFIARVIAKSKAKQQQRGDQAAFFNNHDSIHAITEEIQQRKRREFELAADNLNAQLLSFEQEKELLNQKAIDIRTRKQRALQILSTNQQHAIKTFFTSPSLESKPPDVIAAGQPISTLDFSSILEALNQSGAQIGQLQSARNDQMSARRQMENALREAQSILESGDKRIEQLQESIFKRKQEAAALHIFPASVAYDGRWGIETYPPTKYGIVYFIRGIVFEMAESAITESETEPGQQLLEHNVQRWRATHETVAQEELLEIRAKCAVFLLADIIHEVTHETAADIHGEFQSSCDRVRGKIGQALCHVFFVNATSSMNSMSNDVGIGTPLASALFDSVYHQLRTARNHRLASSSKNEPTQFPCQSILPKRSVPMKTSLSKPTNASSNSANASPKKTRFGLFSSSKSKEKAAATSAANDAASTTKLKSETCNQSNSVQGLHELLETTVLPLTATARSNSASTSSRVLKEKQFWQQTLVEINRTCSVPPHFASCSCIEISDDAGVLAAGTTAGEILLWDLHTTLPVVIRSHVPGPKATKTRITRIYISANKTQIISLNQLHVVQVWSVNKILTSKRDINHSSECFSMAYSSGNPQIKWKPLPLDPLVELNPMSALAVPALPAQVRQQIASSSSTTSLKRDPPIVTQFLSTNFFASTTILGHPTSVLCGASNGDILKFNWSSGKQIGSTAAKFEAPSPDRLADSKLETSAIQREFFCAHKHPVLFVACLYNPRSAVSVPAFQVLSIDSDATILLWGYDHSHFSGFGWFTPRKKYRLDLHMKTEAHIGSIGHPATSVSTKADEIVQIAMTSDETRVVLMVYHELASSSSKKTTVPAGKLQFVLLQLDGVKEDIEVAPVHLQVDFAGATLPRFALTTVYPRRAAELSRAHFLFLLMNNSVSIISLSTGENCCQPILLTQHKSEASLVFNEITVTKRCLKKAPTHCTMAATGNHHNKILIYRFKQQPDEQYEHKKTELHALH